MHKSQLRRLARDFANGKIEREAYTRRRDTLIDGIADGEIEIVREPPPRPPPPPPESPPPTIELEPESRGLSPLHVVVGAAVAVVVVVAATWLLWPDKETVQIARTAAPAITQPTPPEPEPAARVLVEAFVEARDWGNSSIAKFKVGWDALTPAEREAAKAAPWFRQLTRAMRDELKTQRALLEFDKTGEVVAAGARLLALGELLGVANTMPEFPIPETETTTSASQTTVETPATLSDLSGDPSRNASRDPSGDASGSSSAQWLAAQAPGRFTLQLFAVNNLDKIGALIERNPDVDFKVFDLGASNPRYRVFYGSFETADAATTAHATLPESVRREQPRPFVKALDEFRATQADGSTTAEVGEDGWLALQDGGHFTLQLFASSSRDNVDRLISAHPSLALKLHTTRTDQSFRVLYGAYHDEATARAAVAKLPATVLESTGAPLVKSIADLQAIAAP